MIKNASKRVLPLLIVMTMFLKVNLHALDIKSTSAILIDTSTGQVLYEKNSHVQREMASTSKLMTYLLTMEAIDQGKIRLSDRVSVSANAASTRGSSYGLKTGDVLTVDELISSMMIISANDSAVVLAEHVSGREDHFVAKMNNRAKALGLHSAYFVNPNGMPLASQDQNKISAKDLALLSRYIVNKYESQLINITSQNQFNGTYKSFTKNNTNYLVRNTSYTDGMKTGYTNLAMHCLVSTAKLKGSTNNRLVSVVLGGRSSVERFNDSQKMLEYGLHNLETKAVVKKGELLGYSEIVAGEYIPVEFVAKDTITLLSPKDRDLSLNKQIIFKSHIPEENLLKGQEVQVTLKLRDGTQLEVPAIPKRGIGILVDQAPVICSPVQPFIKDGTTLVPLGNVVNHLGASLVWEPLTKTINGKKGLTNFTLTIGNNKASVNGSQVDLGAAPVIVEGTTMVPIKFIAQSLGMDVQWESASKTVNISS